MDSATAMMGTTELTAQIRAVLEITVTGMSSDTNRYVLTAVMPDSFIK